MRLDNLLHLLSFNRWFTLGTVPEEVRRDSIVEKLTEDILFQIFLKLPIKSLLACKCVCRTWRTSIRHRDFAHKHLIQSTQERYITDLIVQCRQRCDLNYLYLSDEYDLAHIQKVTVRGAKIYHHRDDSTHPLNGDNLDIIGSCNGLLCFKNRGISTGIYICNPITGDYVFLPQLTPVSNHCHGFGFDAWTGQYKVVRSILNCNYPMEICTVICTVDSSGNPSPSWRRIENFPLPILLGGDGVFADGALHWVSQPNPNPNPNPKSPPVSRDIVSLDMRDEKLRVMPWPDFMNDRHHYLLHEWRGHLSIFYYPSNSSIQIWVLKDCKGKMDWSEEVRIEWRVPSDVVSYHLIPLGIKKNGEILLSYNRIDLASYDINNRRLTSLELYNTWGTDIITDVVTLVSPIVHE